MFQNMLYTTLTPLENTKEEHCWQNRPFLGSWPEVYQEAEEPNHRPIKQKKRTRTCYTSEQILQLETVFKTEKYCTMARRIQLAASLNLKERMIKIWFQNRRMKEKKDRISKWESMINNTSVQQGGITPSANHNPLFGDIKSEVSPTTYYSDSIYSIPNQDINNFNTVSPPPYHLNCTVQSEYGHPSLPASAPSYEHTYEYPINYFPNDNYNYGENCEYYNYSFQNNDSDLSNSNSDLSYFLLE